MGSCHTILMKDLGMHQVSTKFVPRILTDDQKLQQFFMCENLLQRANDDENLLKNVHTGDRQGFKVTKLKPNNNPQTGRVLLHLAPRKYNRCACE
jgi:hypothetical protein